MVATHRLLYLLLVPMDSEGVVVLSTGMCVFVAAPFFRWLADAKLHGELQGCEDWHYSLLVGFNTCELVQLVVLQYLLKIEW